MTKLSTNDAVKILKPWPSKISFSQGTNKNIAIKAYKTVGTPDIKSINLFNIFVIFFGRKNAISDANEKLIIVAISVARILI